MKEPVTLGFEPCGTFKVKLHGETEVLQTGWVFKMLREIGLMVESAEG